MRACVLMCVAGGEGAKDMPGSDTEAGHGMKSRRFAGSYLTAMSNEEMAGILLLYMLDIWIFAYSPSA